jgi:hypothetical protein
MGKSMYFELKIHVNCFKQKKRRWFFYTANIWWWSNFKKIMLVYKKEKVSKNAFKFDSPEDTSVFVLDPFLPKVFFATYISLAIRNYESLSFKIRVVTFFYNKNSWNESPKRKGTFSQNWLSQKDQNFSHS